MLNDILLCVHTRSQHKLKLSTSTDHSSPLQVSGNYQGASEALNFIKIIKYPPLFHFDSAILAPHSERIWMTGQACPGYCLEFWAKDTSELSGFGPLTCSNSAVRLVGAGVKEDIFPTLQWVSVHQWIKSPCADIQTTEHFISKDMVISLTWSSCTDCPDHFHQLLITCSWFPGAKRC